MNRLVLRRIYLFDILIFFCVSHAKILNSTMLPSIRDKKIASHLYKLQAMLGSTTDCRKNKIK